MVVVGILPIVLILLVLVMCGVAWLFHHHHLRPFAGFVLLVIGLGFLWIVAARQAAQPQMIPPRSVQPVWPSNEARTTSEIRTGTGEARSVQEYISKQQIPAEKPAVSPQDSATARTAEKTDDQKTTSSSDHGTAPESGATKDADRKPAWVGQALHSELRDGEHVYVASVASGLYSSPDECERAIITEINKVVATYAANNLRNPPDVFVFLDPDYIRDHLVKAWYTETSEQSVGTMHQLYELVVFDSRIREELQARSRAATVAGRLGGAAVGTVITLLMLGGVYLVLKKGTSRPTAAAT